VRYCGKLCVERARYYLELPTLVHPMPACLPASDIIWHKVEGCLYYAYSRAVIVTIDSELECETVVVDDDDSMQK